MKERKNERKVRKEDVNEAGEIQKKEKQHEEGGKKHS
jgi:hypothetical protein